MTAAAAAATTTIRKPGQCGRTRRRIRMNAIEKSAIAMAAGRTVPAAAQSAASFGTSSPGSCARSSPNRSFNWLVRMMTAMPAVKPDVTGYGMYLM